MPPQRLLLLLCVLSMSACGSDLDDAQRADADICEGQQTPAVDAIAACSRLLANVGLDASTQARFYFFRGAAYDRSGDHARAIIDMDRSLVLSPGNSYVIATRGSVYAKRGDQQRALVDYDEAIRLDPEQTLAWGNRAILYERRGDLSLARADINRAIQLDGGQYLGWSERCWIRAIAGDELEAALTDCDHAIGLEPRDPNTFNTRGLVKYRLGRYADAIADYDIAIAGAPTVASSFLIRGLAKRSSGDASGAASDIEQALAIDPNVIARYRTYGIAID